ncbi:MAG TPA: hypothetical protein VIE12_10445 [Actinomycetota bacterium]|jgi:hypothetical protein
MPDLHLRDRLEHEAERVDPSPELLSRVFAGHRRRQVRRRVAAFAAAAAVTVAVIVWLSGAFLGSSGRDRPATVPGGDPLRGTWSAVITPELAERAGRAAGFGDAQVARAVERMFAEGSPVTVTLSFDAGELALTSRIGASEASSTWGGRYQVVDADTFVAGDNWGLPIAGYYLEYAFAVDGDALTIDLIRDDYPTPSDRELVGETIAQTLTYESAPFTRTS